MTRTTLILSVTSHYYYYNCRNRYARYYRFQLAARSFASRPWILNDFVRPPPNEIAHNPERPEIYDGYYNGIKTRGPGKIKKKFLAENKFCVTRPGNGANGFPHGGGGGYRVGNRICLRARARYSFCVSKKPNFYPV